VQIGLLAAGACAFVGLASIANATTLSFGLDPFTGDPSGVLVTLDDTAAGAGNIQITVEVSVGVGDIRGVLFDVTDDVPLEGLMVGGANVTDVRLIDVIDLGGGANLQGGGSPCHCDVGVEIGRPGLRGGSDDFSSTTIVLMHAVLELDLSIFDAQAFGVRLTSTGPDASHREGSSKLAGVVPEPSTAALLAAGLAWLAGRPRRGLRRRATRASAG
jgi:hypothetical protein